MTFEEIVERFTRAVVADDGGALGALFAEDGIYVDGFYGPFQGRDAIGQMLHEHFHGTGENYQWVMRDLVCDGETGYARYLFSYDSKLPEAKGQRIVFEGMSQFVLADGEIACYREVFDKGIPLAQLGFAPERMGKSLRRWANELRTGADVKEVLGENLDAI